jgi:hypothetical protein
MADTAVWEYMLRMNNQRVRQYKRQPDDKVFTFSHFLPRAELPAPWGVTEMAKNVGCKELDLQVPYPSPQRPTVASTLAETRA